MSGKATRTLALKVGHPTAFRRTLRFYKADPKTKKQVLDRSRPPVQMVFEPGKDYEVTQEELDAGLQQLVDVGLLVDPNRDPKGRQRRPSAPTADAAKEISGLEKKVERLSAENAELKKKLEEQKAAGK